MWIIAEVGSAFTHIRLGTSSDSSFLKYSLFYGRSGVREVGYDNECGKGDHRHFKGGETPMCSRPLSSCCPISGPTCGPCEVANE